MTFWLQPAGSLYNIFSLYSLEIALKVLYHARSLLRSSELTVPTRLIVDSRLSPVPTPALLFSHLIDRQLRPRIA